MTEYMQQVRISNIRFNGRGLQKVTGQRSVTFHLLLSSRQFRLVRVNIFKRQDSCPPLERRLGNPAEHEGFTVAQVAMENIPGEVDLCR